MFFVHCRECGATARCLSALAGPTPDAGSAAAVSEFEAAHARCRVSRYVPTGIAASDGPWHEPLVERRLAVDGEDGPALAIGARASLDEPLSWRIEPIAVEEELAVALDRGAFHATLDRALYPHHLPARALSAWATQIEDFVRRATPEDLVLLHDDPQRPEVTYACLTLPSRVALETSLECLGLDEESARRIFAAFDDPGFPPLCITRRLVPAAAAR